MVPYNASTAKVLIAVSTVTVNHDGRGGTAPDPLFWDQGGPKKHASFQVHGGCSSGADIAAWPYSVGILCKFTSFLGTLHLPTCPGDIGHFGVSFLELLILFEQWSWPHVGANRPILIPSVPVSGGIEIRHGCQLLSSLVRART